MKLFRQTRPAVAAMLACIAVVAGLTHSPGAWALACNSLSTGIWNLAARWSCGRVPTAADTVTIAAGHTVTLDVNSTIQGITISAGAPGGTLQTDNNNRILTLSTNATLFTLNAGGSFVPGNSTVVMNRDAATTALTAGTAITFNNLQLTPILGGNRTYNFGAGAITINGSFDINPSRAAGGVRTLTVNMGAAITVIGTTTITGTGNGRGLLNTTAAGNYALTSATLNVAANGTFTANASMVTLNGAPGPLFTRAGTFNQGTSNVVMQSGALVSLNSGTITFSRLTIDMAGQTGTQGSQITIAAGGQLNVNNGTLDDNAIQIVGNATATMSMALGTALVLGNAATATAFPTNFTTANIALNTTSTVTYNSNQPQTISGTPIYGNLTLAATAAVTKTAATALDINGSLTIGANNTLSAGALSHTLAGNFTNNGSFTASTSTVTLDGSGAQAISGATTFNNLTLSNTSATITASSPLTVAGNLTLSGAAVAFADGGNTITVNGGIANSGTHSGAGKIVLSGGTAAHALSGSGTYANLEMSDASFDATLTGTPTVSGTLTFTNGRISTSGATDTLIIGAAGSITGATTARHVVGNLAKTFNAAGSFTYEVGDGTNYTPVTANFTSLTTLGNLTVSTPASAGDHPNTTAATSGVDSAKSVNRYWTLKNWTLAGTCNVTLNYLAADVDGGATAASFVIRRGTGCSGSGPARTCPSWTGLTVSGTPTTTQATASGVSISGAASEDDIALGEAFAARFSRENEFIYSRELY